VEADQRKGSDMRCAIYARVSTRDKGQEIDNQLIQLRDFAIRQGWEICYEFIDHEPGAKSDRPEFQRMFHHGSQRKFDVLLFWSLDRLSREGVLETLQHLNRLTSYGVSYRSLSEQYFDSCGIFKEAVISILATIAKQERVRISERVKAGQTRARLQGKRIGRPRATVSVPELVRLRTEGLSFQSIADRTGISIATAFNLLKQLG
jgi:DNA invertase Pin-like site-specific DNA recombinase